MHAIGEENFINILYFLIVKKDTMHKRLHITKTKLLHFNSVLLFKKILNNTKKYQFISTNLNSVELYTLIGQIFVSKIFLLQSIVE